jgi:hypothetical protein
MVILIAVVAILLTVIVALVLAAAIKGLDHAVIKSSAEMEAETRSYNPAVTLGYQIQVEGDKEAQYKEARKLAAKQAAAMPRGANMQIGPQYKKEQQVTAFAGVNDDPITAVKIASIHGWDGLHTGIVAVDPATAAAPATAAPAPGGKIKLVPGKDYPVIEITDSMPADEKRKARIANAKAKSAAMKAAKAAQESGATVPTAAVPAATTAAVPAPAAAAGIPEPEYIEITDDMTPEEKRKARIANSKAKSAYKKALKAAGVDASAAAPTPVATPAAQAVPSPAAAAGVPEPEYIEIIDDMSPDEVRKARIANAKAKSAYNKALKAAGVDPSAAAAPAAAPAPTAAPVVEAAPVPAAATPDAASGIPKPELIQITDDMSPDEKRQARIANSKAKSAYNKALKAAGIDPKSVK